ncbi:MAG TPA: hypothetical protein VN638_03990, partial [Nitrospiraceae bacterium]|nr:hypothetical protein [Nitrospiraceae bacterium]
MRHGLAFYLVRRVAVDLQPGGIMGKDENRSSGKPQSVLFVCTGNIFRSVAAEYALKAGLGVSTY